MKIVLRTDVAGLGKRGDITEVADGYAGNFLIPKGLASRATLGAEKEAANMRRTRELRDAKERAEVEAMAKRVAGKSVLIAAKAGDGGKLFGSVTSADVVRALADQVNVTLDRRVLAMDDPIKRVGVHTVAAKPHPEVSFEITVEVIPD